jgi:hypothetical protein|tara:strand:+ start:22794 stop:23048 length:255 start_codon:yes stop_codon:yes gene_type:complete
MRVEEVFDKKYTPPSQCRPNGHLKKRSTKKGSTRRGLRGRLANLLDEESESEGEDEEDDSPCAMVDLLQRLFPGRAIGYEPRST